MKKAMLILASCAMFALLAGCGGDPFDEEAAPDPGPGAPTDTAEAPMPPGD